VDQILAFLQELLRPSNDEPQAVIGRPKPGRPVVLTSDHLWLAMLVAILRNLKGVACVWRLITWEGIGGFPLLNLTRDGIRKRLLHANMQGLQELLTRVSAALLVWTNGFQDQSLAPFATEVFALDQTTLDAVRRACQDVRTEEKGSPRLIVGKLLGFFDLRRQQWRRILFRDDAFVNEKHLVEELFGGIQPGTLILADLGFFSFAFFDWLGDLECWWLSRVRERVSYEVVHVFAQQDNLLDALVWLGAYRSDQAKRLVRLIEFEHAGLRYRYLTNVLDPAQLSMLDAARLYARRWDIEMAFKALKMELGIGIWWSSHQILVIQQLWCAIILAQVLHALHLRVACEAGVDLFAVSLQVLAKLLAHAPARPTRESLISLLVRKGKQQGLIRPSRRYQAVVPALLQAYVPAPVDLPLTRNARYAHRRRGEDQWERKIFAPRFFSFFIL
jgi:hypothetical protein